MDHPEDALEDRAEDDQDTDDLYPARSRAGAAPDEHEQDEGYLGRSVPLVEVRRHVPARRDDARYGKRRVSQCSPRRRPIVPLEDQHTPHEEDRRHDDPRYASSSRSSTTSERRRV